MGKNLYPKGVVRVPRARRSSTERGRKRASKKPSVEALSVPSGTASGLSGGIKYRGDKKRSTKIIGEGKRPQLVLPAHPILVGGKVGGHGVRGVKKKSEHMGIFS